MLVEKERVKQKIIEFISNQYWLNNTQPTYSDIHKEFKHLISMGSTNNYLEELIDEKKIIKTRNGNQVFYGPPKMNVSTKVMIFFIIFTFFSTFFSFYIAYSFIPLFFGMGAIFTAFLWRILA